MKNVIKEIIDTLKFTLFTFLWLLIGCVPVCVSVFLFVKTDELLWFLLLLSYSIFLPIMELLCEKSLKYLIRGENQ